MGWTATVNSLYFHSCNPIFATVQLAPHGNTRCIVSSGCRPLILHHGNVSQPLFGLSTHLVIIYLRQERYRQRARLSFCGSWGVTLEKAELHHLAPCTHRPGGGKDGSFTLPVYTGTTEQQGRGRKPHSWFLKRHYCHLKHEEEQQRAFVTKQLGDRITTTLLLGVGNTQMQ